METTVAQIMWVTNHFLNQIYFTREHVWYHESAQEPMVGELIGPKR